METKVCTRCGEKKDNNIKNFATRKDRQGNHYFLSSCRTCYNKHVKIWRKKSEKNKETVIRYQKTQKYISSHKESEIKARKNLSNKYINNMIYQTTGIGYALITDEMRETKRAQLKLFRTIRKLKEDIKNGTN